MLIDGRVPGTGTELEHEPGANTGAGPALDGYYTELFVGEDRVIGWPRLTRGRHTVTFVCTGKNAASTNYFLGLDGLVLSRVAGESPTADSASSVVTADRLRAIGALGPGGGAVHIAELRAALGSTSPEARVAAGWAFTQLARSARPAMPSLVAALGDSDHVVRGLAALALRGVGSLDDAAIDAVAGRLTDPDAGVRMMAAWALAAQGTGALRAMPALLAAGRVTPEHQHVQRAVADAFGAMGPAAAVALPVLEEIARRPLSRWNAVAAIRRIRGERDRGGR